MQQLLQSAPATSGFNNKQQALHAIYKEAACTPCPACAAAALRCCEAGCTSPLPPGYPHPAARCACGVRAHAEVHAQGGKGGKGCGAPEVCDRRELGNDGAAIVVASLNGLQRLGSRLLFSELDIHVAHHVVSEVVAHVHVLQLTKLGQLLKDVLVEVLGNGEGGVGGGARVGGCKSRPPGYGVRSNGNR